METKLRPPGKAAKALNHRATSPALFSTTFFALILDSTFAPSAKLFRASSARLVPCHLLRMQSGDNTAPWVGVGFTWGLCLQGCRTAFGLNRMTMLGSSQYLWLASTPRCAKTRTGIGGTRPLCFPKRDGRPMNFRACWKSVHTQMCAENMLVAESFGSFTNRS